MLAEERREFRVVGVLVFTAEDEVDGAIEGGDGLGGGVDVGGLGIVEELDAIDGGDELEAVLDGLEFLDSSADGVGGRSGEARGANSGENVFDVVLAFERDAGKWKDAFGGGVLRRAIDDVAVFDPCPLGYGCSSENQ